jgi:branched-chain amino acid transport system substrate-binding protein
MAEIGWKPMHFLNNVSASVGTVMKPAGFENSQGIISSNYMKDPTDAQWKNDRAFKEYQTWLKKYYPDADPKDAFNVTGYVIAEGVVRVLEMCGNDLTRENVMKQMASIKNFEAPMMLPGIKWNTSADDFFLIEAGQLGRFDGKEWKLFGKVLGR